MRKLLMLGVAALAFHAVPAMALPNLTVTGVAITGETLMVNSPKSEQVIAGPLTLTTSMGSFTAWCVDLYHQIAVGTGQSLSYTAGVIVTDSAPVPTTLTTAQTSGIANLATYGTSLIGTAQGTLDNLTAVQLAIWSVEYPTFSYTGGPSASTITAVEAAANANPASDVGLLSLSGTQNFVVGQGSGLAVVPVPEPAALALVAGGLLALAAVRRRA